MKRENSNPSIGLTALSRHDTVWQLALSQRRTPTFAEVCLRTLGSMYLALLLQAQGEVAPPPGSASSLVNVISRATPVGKSVLVLLALFSVASWSIILYKIWTFSRAERQTTQFLEVFRRSNKFS